MGHKQFGQEDWLGVNYKEGQYVRTEKRGFGYFIRYCDCGAKFYITQEELNILLRKTNFPLPLREILTERFIRWLRIPKISFVVEWRRLEEIKKIPMAREEKILALRRSGWTQEQIAKQFSLTRQRICQILSKAKANRGVWITENKMA